MWDADRGRLGASVQIGSVLLVTVLVLTTSVSAGLATAGTASAASSHYPGVDGSGDPLTAVGSGDPSAEPGGDDAGVRSESRSELTLVTGDTVIVENRGPEMDYQLKGNGSAAIYETRSGTYVVPASVNTSRFSRDLFNVDVLRSQNQTDAVTGQIPLIVEWSNATAMRQGVRQPSRAGVTRDRLLEMMNGSAVSVSKENASAVYRFLAGSDAVESVHYNAKYRGMAIDPRGNINAAFARQAFDVTGDGVSVAVLDTGVNESHPDIGSSEVDEVNFVEEEPARDLVNHGTPAAGLITGDGTASNGSYVGVAPESDILDVKVLGADTTGTEATLIEGLHYAIEADVDVISMSLGANAGHARPDDPFYRQIRRATAADITVVAASGNGDPGYYSVDAPGIHESVLTVGSSANESRVPDFSNQGPTPIGQYVKPDLVAPGIDIQSPSAGGEYSPEDGTSYATPLVSGAAALLAEKYPSWDDQRVKHVLTSTASPIGSQDVYTQGAGNLNVSAALDPGIVLSPGTIDFGFVRPNSTVSKPVTVRNLGTETRNVSVSASAVALRTRSAGTVTTNRSSLTLRPGEQTTLKLTVDTTDAALQPHSGRLRVGDASAIFGYSPNRIVAVTKRGLGPAHGDRITLVHEATGRRYDATVSNRTDPRVGDTGLQANFEVSAPGEYTAISSENHGGQPIITVNSTTVAGGVTSLTLDESETVRHTIDSGSLSQDGNDLVNRSIFVNTTVDGAPVSVRNRVDDPASTAVRVSPSPAATHHIRRIVTAGSQAEPYNASSVYHLLDVFTDPSGDTASSVDSADLKRHNVRYYRGFPGETYRATVGSPDVAPSLAASWAADDVGTTFEQTVYVSPGLTQYHDSYEFSAANWVASAQWDGGFVDFDGNRSVTTAIKKHPFRSTVDEWTLTADAFDATVFPTVGQPPNGYIVNDSPPETFALWVNGERRDSFTRNSPIVDVPAVDGEVESVRLRVEDSHRMSPLSADTVTTVAATTNGSDARPPTVPSIAFESHSKTNVVPNGTVDVTVSTADEGSGVRNASLYVATRNSDGVPGSTPFENATGWRRVALTETRDGSYETTLELGTYRGTLSVALRAVDDAGNYVETTATDGLVVGSRTPTANLTANRTLVEAGDAVGLDASGSYDDQAVTTYAWDFDGDGAVDERTASPTVTHRYTETGTVNPAVTARDSFGFENTTHPLTVAVGSDLPPGASALDGRTVTDLTRAVERGQVRTVPEQINDEQDVYGGSLLIASDDVNGGFDGADGSTITVDGGRVNGETEGHNVVAADARFNGGIEADGTVSVSRGAVTARGGIVAEESVHVLANSTLTLTGEFEATTVRVGRHGSLTVRGDAEIGQLIAGADATVQIRGRLDCEESQVDAAAGVDVQGHSECDGVGEGSVSPVDRGRNASVQNATTPTLVSTPIPTEDASPNPVESRGDGKSAVSAGPPDAEQDATVANTQQAEPSTDASNQTVLPTDANRSSEQSNRSAKPTRTPGRNSSGPALENATQSKDGGGAGNHHDTGAGSPGNDTTAHQDSPSPTSIDPQNDSSEIPDGRPTGSSSGK